MKRFTQQFNTAAKRVTMTKAESRELKERLVTYMEYHPLPEAMRSKEKVAQTGVLASEPFWVWRFNTMHTRAFASMFALIVAIVVPFAAEQAVPGDALYPVKVRFNEEIRSSLALTPYQQVEWETRRVERRLAEARLLATEGKLTEEVEAEVAAAVKNHSSAAQAGLAELRETDRDEAAIAELTFASALEVESEVLESETERQKAAGASTTVTLAAAMADIRAGVASPENTEVSFERLLARVEQETTYATELLLALESEATQQEQNDINRRLADIERKMELALKSRTAAAETASSTATAIATTETTVATEVAAKQYLRDALRDAQKLVRFMTDIDVKANVSVDELVPLTPTEEEERVEVQNKLNLVIDQQRTLEQLDLRDEKSVYGLSRVRELVGRASSSLAVAEFATARAATEEALALLADVTPAEGGASTTPSTSATNTETVVDSVASTTESTLASTTDVVSDLLPERATTTE